jgi:hypothetical protein
MCDFFFTYNPQPHHQPSLRLPTGLLPLQMLSYMNNWICLQSFSYYQTRRTGLHVS